MGEIPQQVIERLQSLSGSTEQEIVQAFGSKPPVSLRVNPWKGLHVNGIGIPWCSSGRYLHHRPVFALDPFFHAGAYYVQEAASMFLEQIVKQCGADRHPIAALDLCAAPGGKSTHLRTLLHENSLLICNEVMPDRRNVLEEVMWKWGYPNVCISQARAQTYAECGELFDLILVDAPCSGSGMMRKDQFAIEQWSTDLEISCARDQRELLDAAWAALKPNGILIYSTCAFSSIENESQVQRMVLEHAAEPVQLPEMDFIGPLKSEFGIYFLPHLAQTEGLFIAAMRKPGAGPSDELVEVGSDQTDSQLPFFNPEGQHIIKMDETFHAVHPRWLELVTVLMDRLRFFVPGIPVATVKNDGLIPHPALALSSLVQEDAPRFALNTGEALEVLRGNVIRRDVGQGFVLGTYREIPFVWMKGVGSRWNTRWPKQWRLRSQRI